MCSFSDTLHSVLLYHLRNTLSTNATAYSGSNTPGEHGLLSAVLPPFPSPSSSMAMRKYSASDSLLVSPRTKRTKVHDVSIHECATVYHQCHTWGVTSKHYLPSTGYSSISRPFNIVHATFHLPSIWTTDKNTQSWIQMTKDCRETWWTQK